MLILKAMHLIFKKPNSLIFENFILEYWIYMISTPLHSPPVPAMAHSWLSLKFMTFSLIVAILYIIYTYKTDWVSKWSKMITWDLKTESPFLSSN